MILWIYLLGCYPTIEERNFPPVLEVISPELDSVYNEGELIYVEAVVEDEQLLSGGVSVSWVSDLDGLLHERLPGADGKVLLSSVSLSPGKHHTTILAEDAGGPTEKSTLHKAKHVMDDGSCERRR